MKGRFAPICIAACLAEAFGYMYDVALTESLPPCGEGGQFALRIGRMRVYCRKAILTALSPSANPLIRHAAFFV